MSIPGAREHTEVTRRYVSYHGSILKPNRLVREVRVTKKRAPSLIRRVLSAVVSLSAYHFSEEVSVRTTPPSPPPPVAQGLHKVQRS